MARYGYNNRFNILLIYRIFILSISNISVMNTITIKIRLQSDIIKLGNRAKSLIGKNVEIIIREINPQAGERKWNHLGKADLGGKADHTNIRDLAHDD